MTIVKRVFLFILTNILVMLTVSLAINIITTFFGVRLGAGTSGLLMLCFIWGFSGALISLFISKFMAKKMMGVQIIEMSTPNLNERQLLQTVHILAKRAGITRMPEVGIYQSPEVNAFATGPSKNNSLVAVSTGLLNRMTPDEVEGVLGHEIAHVANGDMVTLTLIQGVVNSFAMFLSRIIAGIITSNDRGESRNGASRFFITMILDMVFTLLGSMVVAAFSRYREFRADAGSAQFAGREKMIAALMKLRSTVEVVNPNENKVFAAFKISSQRSGFMALFSTHPPLELRIERLRNASRRV